MSKIKSKNNTFCLRSVRAPTTKEQRARSRYTCVHSETQTHRGAHETERWRGGGHSCTSRGHKGGDNTHTHALFVLKLRACVCVRARACRLPPQSASSLLRRRKRPRTKWESSRSSSTIPGAPLSSSAALLHRLLLLPSPWLSPRDPPLRCPPVMSRSCEFTGGNSPSAARASSRLSPCVSVCVCVVSHSPVRRCRRAIGFLHLTSAHCADSVRFGGAAGEA